MGNPLDVETAKKMMGQMVTLRTAPWGRGRGGGAAGVPCLRPSEGVDESEISSFACNMMKTTHDPAKNRVGVAESPAGGRKSRSRAADPLRDTGCWGAAPGATPSSPRQARRLDEASLSSGPVRLPDQPAPPSPAPS